MYEIKENDNYIVKFAKQELNRIDDQRYTDNYKDNILSCIEHITNIDSFNNNINKILDDITKILKGYLLTILTFDKNDFHPVIDNSLYEDKELLQSNICSYVYIDNTGNWFNARAYKLIVNKAYDNIVKEEISNKSYIIKDNEKIYITRGGVITGEYIQKCYIKSKVFYLISVVNIDCDVIKNYNNKDIYIVDSRCPKLKKLMEFYDIPIYKDENIEHIDIRKFKKL